MFVEWLIEAHYLRFIFRTIAYSTFITLQKFICRQNQQFIT